MGEKRPDDPVLFAMKNTKTLLTQHGAHNGDAGRRLQESQLRSLIPLPEWHEAPANLSQATGAYDICDNGENSEPGFFANAIPPG